MNISQIIWMDFQGPTFNLEIPSDWYITATPQLQAVFLGPELGGTRPNVSISMRPVTEEVTTNAVANEARKNQQTEYANYQVLSETDYTQTGGAAYVRSYRWDNIDRNVPVQQVQMFIVYNRMLYTLTATCIEKYYTRFDEIFVHMVETFRLRGNE